MGTKVREELSEATCRVQRLGEEKSHECHMI